MKRKLPFLALLIAVAVAAHDSTPQARWWRGNTHTHTLWSDGDGAPELVADWYRSNGYQFLVLSDHNVLSRGERWFPVEEGTRLTPERLAQLETLYGEGGVDTRERQGAKEMRLLTLSELRERFEGEGEFLFIEGEEVTSGFEGRPVHINALNLDEVIPPLTGADVLETLQLNVDAIVEQGQRLGRPVLAHINHPNFHWGLGVSELAALRGERFFEVYNGHPSVANEGDADHPSTQELWDLANTLRLTELGLPLLFGVATDDAHGYHDAGPQVASTGRGWVVVRAPELAAGPLIEAMKAGDFYASSGVELRDVAVREGALEVQIAAAEGVSYTTRFHGTRRVDGGWSEPGELLAETSSNPAIYHFAGGELFVRATVHSSRPHPNPYKAGEVEMAWVQPVQP